MPDHHLPDETGESHPTHRPHGGADAEFSETDDTLSEEAISRGDDELLERGEPRLRHVQRVSYSKKGMVVTAHYRATEAGSAILKAGGNAVDAAVAAAFALGVCEPAASGLGGQTMMVVHLAEGEQPRTFALDGSSRVPNRAVAEAVPRRGHRLRGYRATTVPATPATLGYALQYYGTKTLAEVLEPAIALAEDGFQVTELLNGLLVREQKRLSRFSSGRVFLTPDAQPIPIGETLRQPALGETLKRLARHGVEDFYQGEIAAEIARDMEDNYGLLHRDDLANIPWPLERKPIAGRFLGMRVQTMSPPGAGRTLVEMMNVISQFNEGQVDLESLDGLLLLTEVLRRGQLDRQDRPFDANFYPQVQDKNLLKKEYAQLVAKQIKARLKVKHRAPQTEGETTHLSVMDGQGNAVGLTQSIERVFGSFVLTPSLGFLYNNYMSAFEYDDITHPYFLRPNAVPWASVAPTILFKGKKAHMVIGSPGSERIVSSILQVLLRLQRQTPADAVAAPRLHCSVKGVVSMEAARLRNDLPAALEQRGFTVDRRDPFAFYLGCIALAIANRGEFTGVADPRRDGAAEGPA